MGFADAIKICFAKYVNFEGRATRPEFWYFVLFNIIVGTVAGIIDKAAHGNAVGNLVGLIFLLPGIAVTTRRLHDIGRSGWWQLLSLTGIGIFLLLFWYCQRGELGSNVYGQDETAFR